MQKRLFIRIVATAVFFITTSAAWGAPVTPEQAFARLAVANGPAGAKGCGPRMRLTHTFRTSDAPSAYVFAGTDGYLLAPADDLAPAVLGYMERFDPDNIPAAMQWWIDQYALTTEWPEPDADDGDHPAIPAMLTTKWGQWAPYNMLCPEDAGVRSVTGCVATALAQILNYHKWPQGTGTGSYSSSRNGYELKFDYGATTFDWSRLRDSYGEDATDAEREEVARLMLACGIGVDMKYSSSSSSASEVGVSRLLTDHLGYDMSAAYNVREYYTYREWDELIYGELAAGRPVLYCGVGDSWGDAHAFVCDGYRGGRILSHQLGMERRLGRILHAGGARPRVEQRHQRIQQQSGGHHRHPTLDRQQCRGVHTALCPRQDGLGPLCQEISFRQPQLGHDMQHGAVARPAAGREPRGQGRKYILCRRVQARQDNRRGR